jgi:transposase
MLGNFLSSLTMPSRESFTSCGRDVDGGHFLLIGDPGTRTTVVGANEWRLASRRKFLDTWLKNQKANSALSTALSVRAAKLATVPSEDVGIKPLVSPEAGTTEKLTAAVDERAHVVALLLFLGQCAETTAAKQLLPLLVKTMVFVGDKGFDSDELRQLIEDNGGLACIPPRSNGTSHRWCDPEFYRKRHLVENIFQRIKY